MPPGVCHEKRREFSYIPSFVGYNDFDYNI